MINYLKQMNNEDYRNEKKILFIIFSSWIFFIFSYVFLGDLINKGSLVNGYKLGGDSEFYLSETDNLINGNSFKNLSRLGFYFVLAPFQYFDIHLAWFVVFQSIVTGIAGLCLYKITSAYFSKSSGLICLLLFLFYIPIQIRNYYILTDILFIDLSIITTYFIYFYKKKYLPLIIICVLLLGLFRQNGILYLFSIFSALLFYLNYKKKYLYIFFYLCFCIVLILPVIEILNYLSANSNLVRSIAERGIIYGYSFDTKSVCFSKCHSVELIRVTKTSSLLDLFNFYQDNFINLMKLFFYKVFWLLARFRPYYSDLHNLYILLYVVALYPAFLYGFVKRPKNNFAINVALFFIFFQIILFGITFVDWSGRFSLYFIPFIMIFSSHGILTFLNFVSKKLLGKLNY